MSDHISWLEQTLTKVLVIGQAFSSEKNSMKLLDLILTGSMEITGADAGTLYLAVDSHTHKLSALRADNQEQILLAFAIARNSSMSVVLESTWTPVTENSIYGYAILTGKSLRIADAYHISEALPYRHNRSFDEKTGYRTKSLLTIPMRDHQGNRIGVMQLINKKEDGGIQLDYTLPQVVEQLLPFTEMDELLMNTLAGQAAVALENAILVQDLTTILDGYRKQNTELIQLEQKILTAHEEERKRIARELHDGPAQSVANLSMKAEICRRLLEMGDHPRLEAELIKLRDQIQGSVTEIRTILYDLKPAALEQGLFQAVRTRLVAFAEDTGYTPDFTAVGNDGDMPDYMVSALYNIVQEALANIKKYAQAKAVTIRLQTDADRVLLWIEDDGVGFDPQLPCGTGEQRLKCGFGLQGMRERIELLRGSWTLLSAPGEGTKISVSVPLLIDLP